MGRDIRLSLQTSSAPPPVSLHTEAGVATLRLEASLDRERLGRDRGVEVTVVCERLGGGQEEVFTLPVTIRVTDVNDNAPVFVSGPYVVNMSEAAPPGSLVAEVVAVDTDQQGPFSMVQYSVVAGEGEPAPPLAFPSPLSGRLVLARALDYEAARVLEVTIRAEDKGAPPLWSETTVRIHVEDADDQNPGFLAASYSTELPGQGTKLALLPEPLRAVDSDLSLAAPVFYSLAGSGKTHYIDSESSEYASSLNIELKAASFSIECESFADFYVLRHIHQS